MKWNGEVFETKQLVASLKVNLQLFLHPYQLSKYFKRENY